MGTDNEVIVDDFYTKHWDGSWTKIKSGTMPNGDVFAKAECTIPIPKVKTLTQAGELYFLRSCDCYLKGTKIPPLTRREIIDLETPAYNKISELVPVTPRPTRILLSGNRTIVFWHDGTKTIVKQSPTEQYSVYAAFTAALAIKLYGSNSKLKKMIRDRVEVQKTKEKK